MFQKKICTFILIAIHALSVKASAVDSLKNLLKPDAGNNAVYFVEISKSYLEARNLDSSIYYAKAAINHVKSGDESEVLPQAYKMVVQYQIMNGNLDSVIHYSEIGSGYAKKYSKPEVDAYFSSLKGSAFYYKGEFAKAEFHYQQALSSFNELNLAIRAAVVYNNLGVLYKTWGQYSKAAEYYQRALEIHESEHDTLNIAQALNNIGNIHYYLGQDYNKALSYYQRSYDLYNAINDSLNQANLLVNIGGIYTQQKKFEEALINYQHSLNIFERQQSKKGIASTYDQIGFTYFEMEEYKTALDYFERAIDLFHELEDSRNEILQLTNIGKTYNKLGKTNEAIKCFNKSIEGAKEKGMLDELMAAYKALSEAYESKNYYSKSLDAYKKYAAFRDTLINKDNIKIIEELQTKYETEKKEQQLVISEAKNQVLELENKRSRIMMLAIGAGFITILFFSLVLYRQFKAKQRANNILQEQRDQIYHQSKEIQDSINYASFIQSAILPPDDHFKNIFEDYFIFYKPKDVVSGDFYWMHKLDHRVVLVVADCTGHGVPGAFMSMLGISALNDIVKKNSENLTSHYILNSLREKVIAQLHQEGSDMEAKDGMDLSLCIFDFDKMEIQFSGAFNPIYLFSDEEFEIFKGDRMPIGISPHENMKFTSSNIKMKKGDRIYFFSDGYPDQFGGEHYKKFRIKPFKELLARINHLPMLEQHKELDKTLADWMGDHQQIDDITVLGVRI